MADDCYKKTLELTLSNKSREQEHIFYQGLANQKLGNPEEAERLFNVLLENVENQGNSRFFTQFGSGNENIRLAEHHYLAGLANLGLGEQDKANNEFTKALEYNPDHVWSKVYLDDVKLKILLPH